ncbi:MAG: hypothetical protein JWM09_974 [Francisellaceae bacterium]|nr:hypothetical protein [Francisellaceae bacterium]
MNNTFLFKRASVLLLILASSVSYSWKVEEKEIDFTEFQESLKEKIPEPVKASNAVSKPIATKKLLKKAVPLTLEEQTLIEYEKAYEVLNKGDQKLAEIQFLKILQKNPMQHLTRSELGSLYIKLGQIEQADLLIKEGLKMAPLEVSFLQLGAIIHELKNEYKEALSYLLMVPQEHQFNINYISHLATVYFELNKAELAKAQYMRLVQMEPSNNKWWLGLSLSLDLLSDKNRALQSYKKTQSLGGFDPSVMDYIHQRILSLNQDDSKREA